MEDLRQILIMKEVRLSTLIYDNNMTVHYTRHQEFQE